MNIGLYEGIPVYIATKEYQRRKHRKKRINKKWRKRYGFVEYNTMPHGQVVFNKVDGILYMTKKTFEEIKKLANKESLVAKLNDVAKKVTIVN